MSDSTPGVQWSKVHLRDDKVRTMSACGQGYTWPSSIGLTDNKDEVTCKDCLERVKVSQK